jgi:hypothetical protein
MVKPAPDDTIASLTSRIQGILSLNKSTNAILGKAGLQCALDLSATEVTASSCPPMTGDIDWKVTFSE